MYLLIWKGPLCGQFWFFLWKFPQSEEEDEHVSRLYGLEENAISKAETNSYKSINDEVKKKRPYWTYWFRAWHQTRLPADQWLGKGIGSGPCG